MKELFALIKHFDLKNLFLSPTTNGVVQFFRYIFVGGVATIVDWGILVLLTECLTMQPLVAAVFAFVAGLITNFILSKLFVFKANVTKVTPAWEFLTYAFSGVIGLGLTEIIMFCCTAWLNWYYMLAKVIATGVVLIWNYLSRKILLYRR